MTNFTPDSLDFIRDTMQYIVGRAEVDIHIYKSSGLDTRYFSERKAKAEKVLDQLPATPTQQPLRPMCG